MDAVNAIIPVVFMLALGYFARRQRIISDTQNEGIKKLIFSILLPILVFNACFTMSIDPKYIQLTGYMFILQCLVIAAGTLVFRVWKTEYSHISPYLMTTIEGGNAFYPLYTSLVGAAYTSYFVLLDVPGIFMIFLVVPLLMARSTSSGMRAKDTLRSVYTNPIICALVIGLVLNLTGAAAAFAKTPVFATYQAVANTATMPIAPLILFTLGHSFRIGRDNLPVMIKTLVVRLVLMALGAAAAFLLFPWILDDAPLRIAVLLFLSCPPAFASPIILEKLYKGEKDGSFCSTYISLHMLATVIIFALIAAFA